MRLAVRTSSADPALPLGNVRTIEQLVWESVAPRRFMMMLLAAFAGIAMLLAAVGIYGSSRIPSRAGRGNWASALPSGRGRPT